MHLLDTGVHRNPVLGDQAIFLKTSAETGGEYTLVELELGPRGQGSPLHVHRRYAERFRVLVGELSVRIGERAHTLREGEEVTAGMNIPHSFSNASDQAVRFTAEMRPGSPGFEMSLKIGYGLARDGLVRASGLPKSLSHLALLFDIGEGSIPGVAMVLEPLLRFIAHRARRQGLEAELVKKYG